MKFYSEKLNKMFDSEAEVVKAEADAQKEAAAQREAGKRRARRGRKEGQ